MRLNGEKIEDLRLNDNERKDIEIIVINRNKSSSQRPGLEEQHEEPEWRKGLHEHNLRRNAYAIWRNMGWGATDADTHAASRGPSQILTQWTLVQSTTAQRREADMQSKTRWQSCP